MTSRPVVSQSMLTSSSPSLGLARPARPRPQPLAPPGAPQTLQHRGLRTWARWKWWRTTSFSCLTICSESLSRSRSSFPMQLRSATAARVEIDAVKMPTGCRRAPAGRAGPPYPCAAPPRGAWSPLARTPAGSPAPDAPWWSFHPAPTGLALPECLERVRGVLVEESRESRVVCGSSRKSSIGARSRSPPRGRRSRGGSSGGPGSRSRSLAAFVHRHDLVAGPLLDQPLDQHVEMVRQAAGADHLRPARKKTMSTT